MSVALIVPKFSHRFIRNLKFRLSSQRFFFIPANSEPLVLKKSHYFVAGANNEAVSVQLLPLSTPTFVQGRWSC